MSSASASRLSYRNESRGMRPGTTYAPPNKSHWVRENAICSPRASGSPSRKVRTVRSLPEAVSVAKEPRRSGGNRPGLHRGGQSPPLQPRDRRVGVPCGRPYRSTHREAHRQAGHRGGGVSRRHGTGCRWVREHRNVKIKPPNNDVNIIILFF